MRLVRPSILVVLTLIAAGCNTVPAAKFQDVERRLQLADEKLQRLDAQISQQQETIRNQQEQVASLRGVKPGSFKDLVYPVRIELERMSGGYSPEGKTGDEGIVLYIQPIDQDGNVIKAAGSIDVKLFDLANPTPESLIGSYHFDVNKTRSLWYGRLLTNHFTVRCPWPPNHNPTHTEITANVVFHDLLTGQELQTQKAFKITLPPVINR